LTKRLQRLSIPNARPRNAQAALEYSYGVEAAAAAAAALDAGLVSSSDSGVSKEEVAEGKLQAKMLAAVGAGDLDRLKEVSHHWWLDGVDKWR